MNKENNIEITQQTEQQEMNRVRFEELPICPEIMSALDERGFEYATEIQAKSLPVISEGKDIIGKSQTGTGKTIAFGIPALQMIDRELSKAQVIILCPTRELAMQAGDELRKVAKRLKGVKIAEVYGGAPMERQIFDLKRANIVVGTPGRVMDHLRRRTLKMDNIKMVVLDEADEMLSMGFCEDIETILSEIEQEHQTVLFSATMPKPIMEITRKFQKDPVLVSVANKVTVQKIKQFAYRVPKGSKTDALILLLQYYNPTRCLIFTNTKLMTDEIAEKLNELNFESAGIHGDLKQSQRTRVMGDYKKGKTQILVATDVAARGIDVKDIDLVINYDIPQNSEYYVHRIGRTGRAGREGTAITLCCYGRQTDDFFRMARSVDANVELSSLPKQKDVLKTINEKNKKIILEKLNEGIFDYEKIVKNLIDIGISAENIAAAALQLAFGNPPKITEIEEPKNAKDDYHRTSRGQKKNYETDDNITRIRINVGRQHKVAANHLVGAITESTGMSGKEIGKIDVYREYSLVSLPKERVRDTAEILDGTKINGVKVNVKPYSDEPPKNKDKNKDKYKDGRSRKGREHKGLGKNKKSK